MKKKILILFALLSISCYSFGCECYFSGAFIKVSKETDLTIVAKIISKSSCKINVEIENVLIGKSDKKSISITGDADGASCLKVLTNYLIGETYAFALTISNDNYYLSACGEYSLKIENGLVKGMINESYMDKTTNWPKWNQKTMSKNDFYTLFKNIGKVYVAPCKSVVRFEDSNMLSEKLEKTKNEYDRGQVFDFSNFNDAVSDNNLSLVKFYIEKTELLKDKRLSELVFLAVEKGYIDIVDLFLNNNVSANMHDEDNFYLVYRAVLYPELLKELHMKGAELNPKGYLGTTTIMHAVREGCIESISYLIENGADLKEKSDKGRKAIDYLEFNRRNKDEVEKFLKSRK